MCYVDDDDDDDKVARERERVRNREIHAGFTTATQYSSN